MCLNWYQSQIFDRTGYFHSEKNSKNIKMDLDRCLSFCRYGHFSDKLYSEVKWKQGTIYTEYFGNNNNNNELK